MISTQDGEIEPTSNTVVARAAGPPVFEFNLGKACVGINQCVGATILHEVISRQSTQVSARMTTRG